MGTGRAAVAGLTFEAAWAEADPDRLCLQGTLFLLHTGIGWEHLPQELGFGSGMTCWRRLEWCQAGVFDRLHRLVLARLHAAGELTGPASASTPAT